MEYPLIEISIKKKKKKSRLDLYRSINFSFTTRGIKLQIVLSGEKKTTI